MTNMSEDVSTETEKKPGIPEIMIDGTAYKVEFSWPTFSEVRKKYGADPDMMDPEVLSGVVALALKRHHPMITAEQLMTASPPMVPVAQAYRAAVTRLFWGDNPPNRAAAAE